jgi:peptidoglycan/xylan/chitin deacetylase (PgdA/CDA1 family)/glycosyltransferase involved in cell wall biosynthesis
MLNKFFQLISRGKLTILLFHKVPQVKHPLLPFELDLAEFERSILLTMQMFKILPLDAALRALRAGNLPVRSACITFDDGYPDWLNGVVPVLERLKIHATFFITTGQLDGVPMWNERVLYSVTNALSDTKDLLLAEEPISALSFSSIAVRKDALNSFENFLKYQPQETRERFISILDAHTGVDSLLAPTMSDADVRELHRRGFDIGAHAVSHPILTRCGPEKAYEEIVGSKEKLESLISQQIKFFAYPNGIPKRDFNCDHIEMVARAGYHVALTTQSGFACASTLPFQIPRFTPWGPSKNRMRFQLARNLLHGVAELPESRAEKRRVLMVAFHFPPQTGSSGILRTLSFAKYLPTLGWNTTVLAANPRAFEQQRNDLVDSIPVRTRVARSFALDAARHLSWRGKYPRLFALPDRWSSWVLPAVWTGMREIRRSRPDLIWSTYPIATAHLIGGSLARLSGLPWVADFRDPMVNLDYPSDRVQRKVWQWLEALVLRNAAACVFTTKRAADLYRSRYPDAATRCLVIENGYEEEAFVDNPPCREGVPEKEIFILHSGIIYPKDRNPDRFFAALSKMVRQPGLLSQPIRVRFRAAVHTEEVAKLAARHGVADIVEIAPPIPYRQAIAEMMAADLLLVFQGSQFNTQIPAKIYEYLRTGRPVVGLVDKTGDTAAQLRMFEGVALADIDDAVDIEAVLRGWFADQAASGGALMFNRSAILAYSRKAQAILLARTLSELAGTGNVLSQAGTGHTDSSASNT